MDEDLKSSTKEIDILIDLTADIASAYVGNNSVALSEVETLISHIYAALDKVSANGKGNENKQPPAVPISKSISQDYLICLEDGKKFKSLKRHLRTHYNLSPEEYREKWGLPIDYPMVAPNYAAARSKLAKNMGLGHKGRRKTTQS
ncbi:MAG: MucR family transcriptional regulator [Alphaproteobacteria bacterium]|nr:MucR family transcriptional regulator [Alphaproteobacteria bacterium]